MLPRKSSRPKPKDQRPAERKEAEALTVAWMLALLASLIAQIAALGSWLLVRSAGAPGPQADEQVSVFLLLPGLMLMVAVISGVACLALSIVVQSMRRTPAPAKVVVGSTIISTIPLITVIVLTLLR